MRKEQRIPPLGEQNNQERLRLTPDEALSPAEVVALLKNIIETSPDHELSVTLQDVKSFQWAPEKFGELSFDRNNAVSRELVYKRYAEFKSLWLASATVAVPFRESVRAAFVTAQTIASLVENDELAELEHLMDDISRKALTALCEFYNLPLEETEALFDDNATLALYQFLSMTNLGPGEHAVTMFDVGKTLTQTLSGEKSQKVVFDSKPTFDIWQNSQVAQTQDAVVGPYEMHLIEHYEGEIYKSDAEIMAEIRDLIIDVKPRLFVVPTVTRSGRLIPFVEMCKEIKTGANEAGYTPVIILDDAQGMSRLLPPDYQSEAQENIWDYADAILGTAAKSTKAMWGTGFMLMNRDKFQSVEIPLAKSTLKNRSRKYGFVSNDLERMDRHNAESPLLANSPEIASISGALEMSDLSSEKKKRLDQLKGTVISSLKNIPGITVLESDEVNTSSVNTLITFFLNKYPKEIDRLRTLIAQPIGNSGLDSQPLSLPKVVPTDTHDYLRISLDQSRLDDQDYLSVIEQLLLRIQIQMENFP